MRRRVPIIPILIGSTKMPTAEQLPPGLKDFAFRNAVKVDTGLDFDYHMDRLIRAMDVILEKKSPPSGETKIPTPPPVKPPPLAGNSYATPAPSSKSHKIPAALVSAPNLDRGAKDKPSSSSSSVVPATWTNVLWLASRNGRIVRAAVAGVIVILLAVVVLNGGTGADRGKPLLTLPGHTAAVTSVAYSPNSQLIVSGSSDRSLKIWDAENGRLVRTLPGDFGAVSSVAFLPDGREIVSASLNGAIIIWNAETGQPVRSLRSNANYSWQSSPSVHSIAVSPDGKRVASGGSGSTVTIWNDSTLVSADGVSCRQASTRDHHLERRNRPAGSIFAIQCQLFVAVFPLRALDRGFSRRQARCIRRLRLDGDDLERQQRRSVGNLPRS